MVWGWMLLELLLPSRCLSAWPWSRLMRISKRTSPTMGSRDKSDKWGYFCKSICSTGYLAGIIPHVKTLPEHNYSSPSSELMFTLSTNWDLIHVLTTSVHLERCVMSSLTQLHHGPLCYECVSGCMVQKSINLILTLDKHGNNGEIHICPNTKITIHNLVLPSNDWISVWGICHGNLGVQQDGETLCVFWLQLWTE